jgi:aminoglycoside phosphotransferase (APT) family kinase protein
MDDTADLCEALAELGLIATGEQPRFSFMTGGVSCDVAKVETADGRVFVIKKALSQLRVPTEWLASADRSAFEVRWLRLVRARVSADLVPEVIAELPERHIFVMAYLPFEIHPVWKAELLEGRVDPNFAGALGRRLVQIHAATAGDPALAQQFATDDLFMALRVDPFLLHVARGHGDVAPALQALALDLQSRKTALVHGDVSPKNILIGPKGPVILDAECAVYGDPAFDLAFCLTHLLIKSVFIEDKGQILIECVRSLTSAYLSGVGWEDPQALSARTAKLVSALLLARLDGKSTATYLTDETDKALIRRQAKAFLQGPALDLTQLMNRWTFKGQV